MKRKSLVVGEYELDTKFQPTDEKDAEEWKLFRERMRENSNGELLSYLLRIKAEKGDK